MWSTEAEARGGHTAPGPGQGWCTLMAARETQTGCWGRTFSLAVQEQAISRDTPALFSLFVFPYQVRQEGSDSLDMPGPVHSRETDWAVPTTPPKLHSYGYLFLKLPKSFHVKVHQHNCWSFKWIIHSALPSQAAHFRELQAPRSEVFKTGRFSCAFWISGVAGTDSPVTWGHRLQRAPKSTSHNLHFPSKFRCTPREPEYPAPTTCQESRLGEGKGARGGWEVTCAHRWQANMTNLENSW